MKLLKFTPISPRYDNPIFEAVALQIVLGLLSWLVMDGGMVAQICGIALIAFWSGAVVLICRRPQSPSRAKLGVDPIRLSAGRCAHVFPDCLDLAS
ncbi:hypothetical protein SBV1_1890013 [Verrucomicrobia bacterium]|nr:hypothetical protein SBV1_1890013 [Verrucomicrobiota bacterium]